MKINHAMLKIIKHNSYVFYTHERIQISYIGFPHNSFGEKGWFQCEFVRTNTIARCGKLSWSHVDQYDLL